MIEIIHPGILATIQDLGREGFRSLGVGVSGAMDRLALRIGNTLLGNPEDAAGIETTLGGLICRFDADCPFAVTGAVSELYLDEKPVPGGSVVLARAGQVLEIMSPSIGMRSYVSFAGGIDVPAVMGSRSTDLKGGFGGHSGRPLRQGDRLDLLPAAFPRHRVREFGLSIRDAGMRLAEDVTEVRMIPAAEWEDCSPEAREQFLGTNWIIDQISNRVGYRLIGPSLAHGTPRELLSHGILPGTIQLPPSGQPVVQMSDANTCGGYPKLGVVIQSDLWKLGQAQLGKAVRFHRVTPEEAIQAMHEERALLAAVRGLAALALGKGETSGSGCSP